MARQTVGEMRMELAELRGSTIHDPQIKDLRNQRELRQSKIADPEIVDLRKQRLQDGTRCEGANGCMGDQEYQVPEDVDSTHAGAHVCSYHYKTIMGRLLAEDGDNMTPRERLQWFEENVAEEGTT